MDSPKPSRAGSHRRAHDLVPSEQWSAAYAKTGPQGGPSRDDPARVRARVIRVGQLTGVLAVSYLVVWGWLHDAASHPEMMIELVGIAAASLSLDLALSLTARDERLDLEGLTRLGYVYFLLRCVVLSTFPVRLDLLAGFGPPRLTLTCLAVASVPVLVPVPPRRAPVLCAFGAATQPLAVLLFYPPPVDWGNVANSAVSATLAVFAGYLCSRAAQGLRGAVERARHLGAYHLKRQISSTDVSEVWLAHHQLLARPAAVKMIRSENVSSAGLERFVREAQVTSLLTSPHTVTLYDYGISEERAPYYAMELLEGSDLQKLVDQRGPLTAAEAIDVALQVTESLEEAHRRGLVHRDLKPSNLFRCRAGLRDDFIKVLDFGLAEFRPRTDVRSASPLVSPRVMGTPAYVVPELVLGRSVDARGDIYQLGCILYFLVTGKPVFVRQTVALTCMAHVVDPAPLASEHAAHPVPNALDDLISRCLEKAPRDRPESAAELRRALLAASKELDPAEVTELERTARVTPTPPAVTNGHRRRDREIPGFSSSEETRASSLLLGGKGMSGQSVRLMRERLARLGEVIALATLAYYVLWGAVNAHGNQALVLQLVVWVAVSVILDMALVFLARSHMPTRTVFNAAMVYLVIRGAMLAFAPVHLNSLVGLEPPRITYTVVLLGLFTWFVPVTPRKVIVPLLLAGASQPLSLLALGIHTGVGDSALNAAVAVIVGYYVTYVSDRLRRAASTSGRLGSYHLVELIGKGAMGEVWRAKHSLLARPAAIKLMLAPPDTANNSALMRRFEREAQVTAALTSPHAVRVFDYGMSSEGALFFAMEFLEGRDLGRLVREDGPRAPGETVRIALEACEALAEAHALGLVHRDLKPENLMQAQVGLRDDFIKVLDFGVVELKRRLERSAGTALATAPVAGTPGYMAPEIITNSGSDARADIYELGCVLFFLLTGRMVFDLPSPVAVAMAHVTAKPPRVSDVLGRPIPSALEAIISRCLAKDPGARFASVNELADALRAVPRPPVVETDRIEARLH